MATGTIQFGPVTMHVEVLTDRRDLAVRDRKPVYQHGSNVPLMTREIEQGTADHHGDELYETRG